MLELKNICFDVPGEDKSKEIIKDVSLTIPDDEFIVVTESGILAEMKRRYPDKTFIPAPPDDETCGCNNCKYMKMVTLENICECLEREAPEIVLDEEVRRKAERSILNMINIK